MVVDRLVGLRVELLLAVLGIVYLEPELRDGLRVIRIADVGEPGLGRPGEGIGGLRDAAVGGAEHALLRVQHVWLPADGARTHGVPAPALLADHDGLALRRPVGVPLQPRADVDDREDLVLGRLRADVDRGAIRRRPCLVARVGRMGLTPRLRRQVVVEIGGGAGRNRRAIHGRFDAAEVGDARRWVVVPQPGDVGGLERDGAEDVPAVLGDREVVDVPRPVEGGQSLRVSGVVRVGHVLELGAVRIGDVVDVHRLRIAHDVVAVLADDEDRPAVRRRDGVDRLGHRRRARAVQRGHVLWVGAVVDVDHGDAVLGRGWRVHLRRDAAARPGDVRAVAGPGHVGVARRRSPAVVQGGVPDEGEPAVVSLLRPPRVLIGLGDVALDPLFRQVVHAAQVVVLVDRLEVHRVRVPLGERLVADDERRAQPDDGGESDDPAKGSGPVAHCPYPLLAEPICRI